MSTVSGYASGGGRDRIEGILRLVSLLFVLDLALVSNYIGSLFYFHSDIFTCDCWLSSLASLFGSCLLAICFSECALLLLIITICVCIVLLEAKEALLSTLYIDSYVALIVLHAAIWCSVTDEYKYIHINTRLICTSIMPSISWLLICFIYCCLITFPCFVGPLCCCSAPRDALAS